MRLVSKASFITNNTDFIAGIISQACPHARKIGGVAAAAGAAGEAGAGAAGEAAAEGGAGTVGVGVDWGVPQQMGLKK